MKLIKLTKGKFTQVDDNLYEYLNQWKWFAIKTKKYYYAARFDCSFHPKKIVKMHRLIMNTPINIQVDHGDHNTLNNQKYNLKNATNSQNQMNKMPKNGGSGYLGVHINRGKYIVAHININGETIHLGSFKTKEAAALAYNKAAILRDSNFMNLNIINYENKQHHKEVIFNDNGTCFNCRIQCSTKQ